MATISCFSASDLALSGCAATSISRRVTTVALCLVSRTEALHAGQVKTVARIGGEGALSAVVAWKLNHSLRQAPQKV